MARIKRNDVQITLTKDNGTSKELTFSFGKTEWVKVDVSTCANSTYTGMAVRFRITPASEDEPCLCKILFCPKLKVSFETLRIENKKTYKERLTEWFDRRIIEFPNDRECIIKMETSSPAAVRLKAAVMFVMENISASLITGLVERKRMQSIDEKLNQWMTETFSSGYSFQTTWDKRKKKQQE